MGKPSTICHIRPSMNSHASHVTHHSSFITRHSGFTLLECIIAIGLYGVMLTLTLQIYVVIYKNLETQSARANLLVASRELTHQFRSDIRCARRALPRFRQWRTGTHALILELPPRCVAGCDGGAWIVYETDLEMKHVTRHFFPASQRSASGMRAYSEPLGKGISNVTFSIHRTVGARPLVEMSLAHRQVVHCRPVNIKLRTAGVMRNG